MAEVPVNIDGITEGQTLVWDADAGIFVAGPRAAASSIKVGATLAALGSGAADGDPAVVRIGAWPDTHEELMYWDASQGKWVGEERVVIAQQDSWAMDLTNRSGAQLLDWSAIDSAVPFGKAYALLTVAADLSAAAFDPGGAGGTITVDDTSSPHSHPFAEAGAADGAYLQVRDNYLTFAGKTGTTLTGCHVVQGSRGVIPVGEYAYQGYPGGWGFVSTPIPYAVDMWTAGFRLQERLSSLCNSGPADVNLLAAPYWTQYDAGDGVSQSLGVPPAGGLGASASLRSPDGSGLAVGNPGERDFYMTVNGWTAWPLAAPTKRFLLPKMVGKMEAGPISSGEVLDTKLVVRWVG